MKNKMHMKVRFVFGFYKLDFIWDNGYVSTDDGVFYSKASAYRLAEAYRSLYGWEIVYD